jgi:alkanesulfonate monooxygenase SsuD/methylene tetrahydromethanopterin reductase-like flavin-dependent oxidoreductase (luciferase family)
MSSGRAELGLGTGWYEKEHQAYGIPFPHKRFGLLAEQLEIVSGLWGTSEGETYSFTGEHYTLTDSPALPKPRQNPVPIIVGGSGVKKTPALAARFATEFNAGFATVDGLRERLARVRVACEDIGRDPTTLTLSIAGTTAAGADEQSALRRAAAIDRPLEELRLGGFAGTTAEIVDKLGIMQELGFTRVYFQIMGLTDLDHLDFLAREVIPQLR